MKSQATDRKYLQNLYLIKDFYPEHMKNSYILIAKTKNKTKQKSSKQAKDLIDTSPLRLYKF